MTKKRRNGGRGKHNRGMGDGISYPIRHLEEDAESLLGNSETRIEMEEDVFPETRFHSSYIP